MSVLITVRIKADPEPAAGGHGRRTKPAGQAINSRAKELGAIHHRFMAGADGTEIIVLDEWESAEAFKKFFEASDDIRAMMGEMASRRSPRSRSGTRSTRPTPSRLSALTR